LSLYRDSGSGGLFAGEARRRARSFLRSLAGETSGCAYFPKSTTDLANAASQILDYPRFQYIVEYSPTVSLDLPRKGKVRVKLVDALGRNKYSVSMTVVEN
jgi:hypothetical protein